MKMQALLGGVVVSLGLAASVDAAIVYSYVAEPTSGALNPGQTMSVGLYLRETVSGGDLSLLGRTAAQGGEGGLFGYGLSFVLDAGQTTAAIPATILSFAANTSAFPDLTGISNLSDRLEIIGSVHPGVPTDTSGVATGPNVREVLLATVTVQGNGVGISTFTVSGYDTGNTLTRENGYDVDTGLDMDGNSVFAPATGGAFQAAVPEPGMVGLALGVIGLALAPRKRAPIAHD